VSAAEDQRDGHDGDEPETTAAISRADLVSSGRAGRIDLTNDLEQHRSVRSDQERLGGPRTTEVQRDLPVGSAAPAT